MEDEGLEALVTLAGRHSPSLSATVLTGAWTRAAGKGGFEGASSQDIVLQSDGNYVVLWNKGADGAWRLATDIWNTSQK